MPTYNQLIDHLVSTMKPHSSTFYSKDDAPFDTPAYHNYKELVNKQERKSFDELYEEFSSKSIDDQVNNLKELGRQLVTRIDGIVDKLNVIIEDIEEEENDNKEEEITVDPLTHKVTYNKETNEYKVVKREDIK